MRACGRVAGMRRSVRLVDVPSHVGVRMAPGPRAS